MDADPAGSIRVPGPDDLPVLAELYAYFARETTATFHVRPPGIEDLQRWIDASGGLPWLVIEDRGTLLGMAYAAPWKPREAYRHTVETSVYVDPSAQRRGIGSALYASLLRELDLLPVRTALAGIVLPNVPSVALHERFGFRRVGVLREVGYKFGRWHDVGYWQRSFPFDPGNLAP